MFTLGGWNSRHPHEFTVMAGVRILRGGTASKRKRYPPLPVYWPGCTDTTQLHTPTREGATGMQAALTLWLDPEHFTAGG